MKVTDEQITIQPSSLKEIDDRTIRHAIWEAVGVLILFIVAWGVFVRFFGLTLEAIANGLTIAMALVAVVIALSFFFKEPALERIAKSIWRGAEQSAATKAETNQATLSTASTNQANIDYFVALRILEATLKEFSKAMDGESLKGRPWVFRKCVDGGFIKNHYPDWDRAMKIWEGAGVVTPDREGHLTITTMGQGTDLLKKYMVGKGYRWLNNTVWIKS